MSNKLVLTFRDDGSVNFSLDKETKTELVLEGLVTALVRIIQNVSGNYATQDRHIRDAVESLNKQIMG